MFTRVSYALPNKYTFAHWDLSKTFWSRCNSRNINGILSI